MKINEASEDPRKGKALYNLVGSLVNRVNILAAISSQICPVTPSPNQYGKTNG